MHEERLLTVGYFVAELPVFASANNVQAIETESAPRPIAIPGVPRSRNAR